MEKFEYYILNREALRVKRRVGTGATRTQRQPSVALKMRFRTVESLAVYEHHFKVYKNIYKYSIRFLFICSEYNSLPGVIPDHAHYLE
jgi:hypothetical protein